jgi:hypothetical protein
LALYFENIIDDLTNKDNLTFNKAKLCLFNTASNFFSSSSDKQIALAATLFSNTKDKTKDKSGKGMETANNFSGSSNSNDKLKKSTDE